MTWNLFEGDCFDHLPLLEDQSIDMILCDLPYGTTACKWDTPLPLDRLWLEYERVIKPNGAIVLTAQQPFTSYLVMSNPNLFKYSWVWDKVNRPTGHLNVKKQPLKQTEDVCVFYSQQCLYSPQMVKGTPYTATGSKISANYGKQVKTTTICDGWRYPRNLISIKADERGTVGRLHPTQKPVALFEYLIKTYTNPGDTVLDNCAGSGTTGVACYNTGRRCIMMEREPEYCEIIRQRMRGVTSQTRLPVEVKV